MPDAEKPPKPEAKGGWMPSPKKVGEFILGVVQLQRSVDSLKKQNEQLTEEIRRLQRQVDEQAGQLKSIQSFIQTAVYDHAARSGERAALAFIEKLTERERD